MQNEFLLTEEVKNLRKMLEDNKKILIEKENEIAHLREVIAYLRRKKFVRSSEKIDEKERGTFNETEDILAKKDDIDETQNSDDDTEKEEITYTRKKNRGKRGKIDESLPRTKIVIDLPDEEKFCSLHGNPLKEIGEEITEQVIVIPAKIEVLQFVRKKYSRCSCCGGGVQMAPLPPSILPKTMASPSLLSQIIISKYSDALPLYRQENIFSRLGIDLPRQTMARWLIHLCPQLIPLYNLLQDRLLARNYLQMDETTTQVLKEDGKKATSKSYMWVRFAPGSEPIVLYDYSPTRAGSVPEALLVGFKGYLQTDGYDGYAPVCDKNPHIIRLGCMDHCRRKFFDAYKTSEKKNKVGKKGITFLDKLYKIEDRIKSFPPIEKYRIRQDESRVILKEMKDWIDEIRHKITPSSLAGKAINYAFNEWKYLTVYLEDGHLNISNIMVENKIRPFVLGKKNWLFSASVEGANVSALFYSLIETAKANDIEPFDYLLKVLEKLPTANLIDDFEALLPLKSTFLM